MDSTSHDLLKQAVQLINMGDTERAQDLLLKTVINDPYCLEAWLWLSELASNLEEQTAMLEEAIKRIPPDSPKTLQDYLAGLHGGPALPPPQAVLNDPTSDPGIKSAEEGYQQASRLASAGKRADALQMLYQIVSNGAHEERFWWMISELEPGLESKIAALLWVVEMNPGNEEAKQRLKVLETLRNQPLSAANFFSSIGETEQAMDMYRLLASKETEASRKRELDQIIASLQNSAGLQPTEPKLVHARKPGKNLLGFVRSLFSRPSMT